MKYALSLVFTYISTVMFYAQGNPSTSFNGKISGKVLDEASKQPVEFATVTARSAKDNTFLTGALINAQGLFVIDKLKPDTYFLSFSFIGYKTYLDTVIISQQSSVINMGTIWMSVDAKTLQQVEIVEEKENFQLAIDKKVFNVEKDLVSAGGSAIDVLKQVPTVSVDVDGKISLRGSENLIIFINGKPSGLTGDNREQILMQIPASNIDHVELITNPSARYDADGMSGIINIITKRNISDGLSGNLTAGVGTYHKYNASGSINYRSEKFATGHTIGFRYNRNWSGGQHNRTNTFDSLPSYSINQQDQGHRIQISPTLSGNFDFTPNQNHSIGITYLVSYGTDESLEHISYQFLDNNGWLTQTYDRNTQTPSTNLTADGGISYTYKLPKKRRELYFSSNISYNDGESKGYYMQLPYLIDGNPDTTQNIGYTTNNSYKKNIVSVTQMDYTHPFSQNYKLELGWKVTIRRFNNELVADTFDYNLNQWVANTTLTNRFIYFEDVNAVYGTFSGMLKEKFGYQVGMRIEQTNITGDQAVGNASFTKQYIHFFPSVFLSYKMKKGHELQLNYSRRINRPGTYTLNPFASYDDPLNIHVGNPNINPENIDAVELNYSKQWKNHTLVATTYFRYISGIIQRYRSVDSAGVSTVTFINLDYSMNFGLEIVSRNKWFKWWSSTTNFNLFRNQLFGTTKDAELNATNFSFSARMQNSFRFLPSMDLQLTVDVRGPMTFAQGRMAEMWGIDLGYRYDFLKGKASITLNLTDIFNTRRFYVDSRGDNFTGTVLRKRETRVATIQFTYRFGKQQQGQQPTRRRPIDGGSDDMDI